MTTINIAVARSEGALIRIAVAALLTSFVAATYAFGFYLFAQLVTDMRADLGFDYATVGTITALGQIGFLAFAVLGAWLTPWLGGGLVVIGSVLLCGLCLALLPLAGSIVAVAILMTVMGGTAASVYVPMVEIVARTMPHQHRGTVLGLVSSGTSYGVFLNSLLVPLFIAHGNWRGLWLTVGLLTLAIGLAGAALFWKVGLLDRAPGAVRSKAAAAGAAIAGTSAAGPAAAQPTWRSTLVPWVLLIWFMTFLNGFSTLPFQNYLSPYLREELGFGVDFAASVWGTIGIIGMVAGVAVGWLSDRTGVRFALVLSYASVIAAATILVIAPFGVLPLIAGILFAFAFYPIFGLIPAYVSKVADGVTATRVFAVANATLGIGGMIGNYAAGALKHGSGSFVPVYVAIAATAVVLLVSTLVLPSERRSVAA